MLSLDGTYYYYYYGSLDSQPHVRIGFGIVIHLSSPSQRTDVKCYYFIIFVYMYLLRAQFDCLGILVSQ